MRNPIHLLGPLAFSLLGAMLISAVPNCARAEPGEAAAVVPDWDAVNRVLQIPQVCASDGGVVTCKEPVTAVSARALRLSAARRSSPPDSSTEEVSSVDNPGGACGLGTLQDYENQASATRPLAIYVAPTAARLRPPARRFPTSAPDGRAAMFAPAASPWRLRSPMAAGSAAMPPVIPGPRGLPYR